MDPTPGRFEMEKFDGSGDFGLWKFKLLGQLEIQGLLSVLSEDWTTLTTKEILKEGETNLAVRETVVDTKKAEKDLRTRNLIATCLSDRILRKVMKETTALGMWKALEKDYQTKSLPNRIYLKQRFASFKMEENKSIEDNVDTFLKLVADLASLKVEISDEDQAIQLLSSLPPSFEPLVHTLKYGTGRETITVNEVTSAAYDKETELKQKGKLQRENSNADSLFVGSRGRSDKRSNNYRGRSKSRGRFDKTTNTGCFICGKDDHWKRECPERKSYRPKDSANLATTEFNEPMVLTVCALDTSKEWIMDSGTSYHITSERDVLFDFREVDGQKVLMANNTHCDIKGIGKIRVKNLDGSEVILKEVRYIPEMSRNLISYGMLERSGCSYKGTNFMVRFYKGNRKVISGKYHDGLYYLHGKVAKAEVNGSNAEKVIRKRKSKKVTFSENLIQGPTPYGFDTQSSSSQGGDSSSSEEIESKESNEESVTESSEDDYVFVEDGVRKEVMISKEEKMDSLNKNQTWVLKGHKSYKHKAVQRMWLVKTKPEIQGVEKQKQNGIWAVKGFSQDESINHNMNTVAKGGIVLPKIHLNKIPADNKTKAVPGLKIFCCDLLNVI